MASTEAITNFLLPSSPAMRLSSSVEKSAVEDPRNKGCLAGVNEVEHGIDIATTINNKHWCISVEELMMVCSKYYYDVTLIFLDVT